MNYLIYPYSDNLSSVVENISFYSEDINITKCVSPIAWKRNIDANIEVSFNFREAIEGVDGVIIADTPENKFMYQDLLNKLSFSLASKKHVICCTELQNKDVEELASIAQSNSVMFKYTITQMEAKRDFGVFQRQDCIVIAIGGMLNELDSLTTMSNLVYRYRELGYRVTAVSDNKNTALFNFVPFPSAILDSDLPHQEIIKEINTFYNELQLLHQPDIIITQIPNGMIKYSNICVENFGVKAYMLSQALSVDYFILTSPIDDFDDASFNLMSTTFKYRFGFKIDAVGIANRYINFSDSNEEEKVVYEKAKSSEVKEFVSFLNSSPEQKILFFDAQDNSAYEMLVKESIDTLTNEARFEEDE